VRTIPLKAYWDLLAKHIKPQRVRFVLLTVLLLSGIGLQLVNPQIVRSFIDSAISGKGGRALLYTTLAFIGVSIVQQVVRIGSVYLGQNVSWTATNALRAELARHCVRLDMSFHHQHPPGELIERVDGDVSELATFFSQLVIYLASNLLLLIGILVMLFLEDWRIGLSFTLFAVLGLGILYRIRGIAVPHAKARRQAQADLFGYLEEQLSGTEDIRSNGGTAFSLRGIHRLHAEILRHDRKTSNKRYLIGLVTSTLLTVGNIIVITAGYLLHRSGAITVGTIYLIVQYVNLLTQPMWELSRQIENLQGIGAAVERLAELRSVSSTLIDGPGAEIGAGALSLAFEDVGFSYLAEEPVLHNLSFRLDPNKVLGVLGRTGSGKTTLARLVFRLYDPTSGIIALNDADLRQPTLQQVRQRIAYVTQDVQIFQATVRDNLTFFNRGISDERIQQAIEDLDLGDWLTALPQGLDTEIAAGGRGLSAGQAQLLALTRVFLRDPGLVVLDEASSRLDPATERQIERTIDKLLQDRTAIIIAHRLSTVHRADEIMILQEGQIDEYGDRAELEQNPASHFSALLRAGLEEVLA